MRLAGKEKGGFYPTPHDTLAEIVRHIAFTTKPTRILDPCAGKGEAITRVAERAPSLNRVEVLMVENNPWHHRDIEYRIDRHDLKAQALSAAWEDVVLSQESVGLLWLNPPYDWEAIKVESDDPSKLSKLVTERVEYTFLKSSTPKLQPGGLLVYIVPLSVIQRIQVLRYLSIHYENFQVFSAPDPEYDDYDQVIVFAIKKTAPTPEPETLTWLTEQVAARPTPLNEITDAANFTYTLPEAPEKYVFRKLQLTYEETAALVEKHGAHLEPAWTTWAAPKAQTSFRPAAPPKLGHVATFITSGMFGVINLGGSVIRGAATKRTRAYDSHGNEVPSNSPEAKELRESFDTEIYQLFADGSYKIISKPADLETLLHDHIELLHALVLRQYNPRYNGDPTPEEWEKVAGLMPKKRLPGRKSAGLLLAQKHAVVAMTRVAKEYGNSFTIADMGCGKGPMGYSIAHSLNAFPLLSMCPPHLVEKHAREALDTLGADIKVVIATKPSDLFRAVDEYEPGQRLIVIAGITTWSLGPGVHRVRVMKKIIRPKKDPQTGMLLGGWEAVTREICPRCGQIIEDRTSASNKPVKCDNLKCREPLYEYGGSPTQHAKVKLAYGEKWSFNAWTEAQSEYATGMRQRPRTSIHRWPLAVVLSRKVPKNFFKGLLADEMHKFKAKGTDRGYAFQRMTNAVHYVINTTGTIFGGYASDLFYLMYRTMPGFRKLYGFDDVARFVDLYGKRKYTLIQESDEYGISTGKRRRVGNVKDLPGISPAIYPLILEQALFMRVADLGYDLPDYREEMPTVVMEDALLAQYVWLHVTLYEEIKKKMSSFNSGDMKEAMRLLSTWLTNTLFRPQSAFRTEMVMRSLGSDENGASHHTPYEVRAGASETYGYTDKDDNDRMLDLGIDDNTLLHMPEDSSGQSRRGKPAAAIAFDKQQTDNKEAMVLYPAVQIDELLPKEKWLLEAVRKEVKAGRKVLVYVEQTAKRNIQPRLKRLLTERGVRAVVLPDGNAREREAWIVERVKEMDVLITNPRKVETGLDLVQFSRIIFYELPTSLFVLMQSMKRVWRLGQTQDVIVYIPYHVGYDDIMEQRILRLMADKVKAAALLYGETASSAFADEAAGSDVTADLAKQILAEVAGATPGQFADGIKSLLGDLVEEELAASRAARQAAIDAGEETAGTGELEEEELETEDAFGMFADGDDETPEMDVIEIETTMQPGLFDFGAFDAPVTAPTANAATDNDLFDIFAPAQETDSMARFTPAEREIRTIDKELTSLRARLDLAYDLAINDGGARMRELEAEIDKTEARRAELIKQNTPANTLVAAESLTAGGVEFVVQPLVHKPAAQTDAAADPATLLAAGQTNGSVFVVEPGQPPAQPAPATPTHYVTNHQVVTQSGRTIQAPPIFGEALARHQAMNSKRELARYDDWLLEAMIAEAEARGHLENAAQTRAWDAITDTRRDGMHLYLFGVENPIFARWTPQVGDQVYISSKLPENLGVVARIEEGYFWIRLDKGNQRKCSSFQLIKPDELPAAQPEKPASTQAATGLRVILPGETVIVDGEELTLRVDIENGGHVYLDNADGAPQIAVPVDSTHRYGFMLPDELIAQVEAAVTTRNAKYAAERARYNMIDADARQPGLVWPGKRFSFNGRDYEMVRIDEFEQLIGRSYDLMMIKSIDVTPGMLIPIRRSWGTLEEFTRTTGLYLAPDSRITRDDLLTIREKIAAGKMVLVAQSIGLPSIHDEILHGADHAGYGMFILKTPEFEVDFDAGGAMSQIGGISYSILTVRRGSFPYPFDKALAAIDWWLGLPTPPPADAPETVLPATNQPIVVEEDVAEAAPAALPAPALDAETATAAPTTATTDFFANWDLNTSLAGPTGDVAVLAITPKKSTGKKSAKAAGQGDPFRRMMNSEPSFDK